MKTKGMRRELQASWYICSGRVVALHMRTRWLCKPFIAYAYALVVQTI